MTAECKHKQYNLTVFPATLEKFLWKGLDNTHIEKRLLDLDSVNVTCINRNIIFNMQSKKSPDSDTENSPHTDDKENVLE